MKRFITIIALIFSVASASAEITGTFVYPGGSDGDVQINDNGEFGGRSLEAGSNITIDVGTSSITINSSGGGGGASALDDLTDATITSPAKDQALLYNGSAWVNAAQGTSFTFSIASFSDGVTSPVLIGTGTWRAIGALSFTATYNNGPPTSSTVTLSGWSALPMTNSGQGPTASAEAATFPSVGSSLTFTLSATDGTDSDTDTETVAFYNYRFWGVSTSSDSFTEADVEGLANGELSNSKAKTFSVSPGSGEYIVFAYPSRLGTATFTVGGFEGGFNSPETVSITNGSAYAENYYVYSSVNSNLGSTTVTAQ